MYANNFAWTARVLGIITLILCGYAYATDHVWLSALCFANGLNALFLAVHTSRNYAMLAEATVLAQNMFDKITEAENE